MSSELPFETIGAYEIRGVLGRGGQAVVYRGYQPSMNREVALKVVPKDKVDSEGQKRFISEAKTIASLEHTGILPVYDFGEEDGLLFIAMRLVRGGSLGQKLKREKRIPPSEVVRIVRELGEALDHAHGKGVLHRDIKPANVLLDDDGHCLLTDFGIAKLLDDETGLTRTNVALGTPYYMSPEQCQGNELDGRSDLYSLGVMAYEMLLGRRPFDGDSPMAVSLSVVRDPVSFPGDCDVPRGMQRVVESQLSKDPDHRYATGKEFARALGTAMNEQTRTISTEDDQTIPQTTIGMDRSQDGKKRSMLPVAGVLAAAALAFGGWQLGLFAPDAGPSVASEKEDGDLPAESSGENGGGTSLEQGAVASENEASPQPEELAESGGEPSAEQAQNNSLVLAIPDDEEPDPQPVREAPPSLPSSVADDWEALDWPTQLQLGWVMDDSLRNLAALGSLESLGAALFTPVGSRLPEAFQHSALAARTVSTADSLSPVWRAEMRELGYHLGVALSVDRDADRDVRGEIEPGTLSNRLKWRVHSVLRAQIVPLDTEDAPAPLRAEGLSIEAYGNRSEGIADSLTQSAAKLQPQLDQAIAAWLADYRARGLEQRIGLLTGPADDRLGNWFQEVIRKADSLQVVPGSLEKISEASFLEQQGNQEVIVLSKGGGAGSTLPRPLGSQLDFWSVRHRSQAANLEGYLRTMLRRFLDHVHPAETEWRLSVYRGPNLVLFRVSDSAEETVAAKAVLESAGQADISSLLASVFLVVRDYSGGSRDGGGGTAWVVGDRVLATNAHVAQQFGKEGVTLSVKAPGKDGKEIRVTGARTHPGFTKINDVANELRPLAPGGNGLDTDDMMGLSCDVGLLYVEEDLGAAPIPVMGREEVYALEPGTQFVMLGYPVESAGGESGVSVDAPVPLLVRGYIQASVDDFKGQAEDQLAHVLRIDAPSTGGSSGSPLIGLDGRVLGLLNSGIYAGFTEQDRIPLTGYDIGQRSDLLTDLLEDVAEQQLEVYERYWREILEERKGRGLEWVQSFSEEVIANYESQTGKKLGSPRMVGRAIHAATEEGDASLSDRTGSFGEATGGSYFILSISELGRAANATVLVAGTAVASHERAAVAPSLFSVPSTGARVEVVTVCPEGQDVSVSPSIFQSFLFRLE